MGNQIKWIKKHHTDKNVTTPDNNFHLNFINHLLSVNLYHYEGEPFIEYMESWMINRIKPRRELLQINIVVDSINYEQYLEFGGKPLEDILSENIVDIEVNIERRK